MKIPYEDHPGTRYFVETMDELKRPIYVHRFAMARIRKSLADGIPSPARLSSDRLVASHAQQECEDIMRAHVEGIDGLA